MRKSWWKIPLYCIVASWICFQLEVRFLVRWTIVTLPDGSISTDSTRRLILNIVLFIIVVAIGGFFFFRKKGCIFSEPAKLLNFLTTDGSKDTGF